ncbi:MAG: hypothetical protein ACKVZH_06740 [Blastocatellia bacterium]
MIRTLLFCLLLTALAPQLRAQDAFALTLEPDYETLWLDASGPRTFEPCNPWPIKPFQPRAFSLRGKIFDGSQNEIGRYFARGVIRQSDGAHVADYALSIKGVGTIVFALDALPDVGAAEIDGFVFSGSQRNTPYNLTIKPRLTTDCVWGMRWEINLEIKKDR